MASSSASKSPKTRDWRKASTAFGLIAAATVAAYHNCFRVPFVFDDEQSILTNPTLASIARACWPPTQNGLTVSGRPVLNVSLALNHAISGVAPAGYHALNLAIHIAAGCLLFSIIRRTLQRPVLAPRFSAHAFELALAIALIWSLHPVQTEAVTYVIQRAESLMGFWFLLTLACLIRGAETGSRRWLAGSITACVLGMATKEVMAAAPIMMLWYDRVFLTASWRELWQRRVVYYGALASTWLVLALLVIATGGRGGTFELGVAHAWWRYDLTQWAALSHYLALAGWPHPLVFDYGTFWIDHPLAIWRQAALVLALLTATILALRRWPAAAFIGGWYFVILAPSSLPPGTIQMIVEHRLYLSLAALATLAVLILYTVLGRRIWISLGAAMIGFALLTARRNQDYASPIRLFEDTVAKRPHNGRALALLGDYYRRAGRRDDARRMLERSLAVEPGVPAVWSNLGDVWQESGQPSRAVDCFRAALASGQSDPILLNNLGNALVMSGRSAEGISQLEAAVNLAPNITTLRLNLASALAQSGRFDAAAEKLAEVVRMEPANADARAAYAEALASMGRPTEAITQLEEAVRRRSEDANLHDQLGVALGRSGRMREAAEQFRQALRLNPADGAARENAMRAERALGNR